MKKLLDLVTYWINEGKKPGYASPADMAELMHVYYLLKTKGTAETIMECVKYMCVECDLFADRKGCGYVISIPGK